MAHDGSCHDAYGTGSGDQDIFAQDREGERRVDRIAEGIKDGGDLAVDAGVVTPDVGHRKRDVFGECSGTVDAHTFCMRTEMTPPSQTVPASATDHVPFSADDLAGMKINYVRADSDDFADKLVANCHRNRDRGARPIVPVVDVDIGAANSRVRDADQNVVDADSGFGDIFEPQSWRGLAFDQGLQRLPRSLRLGTIPLAC